MGSRYDHITVQERHLICRWRDAKVPVRVISERLGRHPSTIHREIRRNWFDDGPWLRGYFAIAADERASSRRRRVGKLHRDPELARFVTERLQQTWSPEQIAGHLKATRQTQAYACHETIYRYVYGPDGRAAELYKLLPRMRRRRRALCPTAARPKYPAAEHHRAAPRPHRRAPVLRPLGVRPDRFPQGIRTSQHHDAGGASKPVPDHDQEPEPQLDRHHGRPGRALGAASSADAAIHHLRSRHGVRFLCDLKALAGDRELLLQVSAVSAFETD